MVASGWCGALRRFYFVFLVVRPPPGSTLFPYTTLFRSLLAEGQKVLVPSRALGELARVLSGASSPNARSEEHTSELQSPMYLVCRLLLEKKKKSSTRYRHRQTRPLRIPTSRYWTAHSTP